MAILRGNRSEIIKIWHGGIAIHGGLIGGFIAGVIGTKVKNLNPFQIGDIRCAKYKFKRKELDAGVTL